MSKLTDLLSKATSEKATILEVEELGELTGKKLPQEIFEALETGAGLVGGAWIMLKRENPSVTKEEISKQVTVDTDIELSWELLYFFTRLTRDQVIEIRKKAESTDTIKVFQTEDYKQFTETVEEANKFMKANKHCKFNAVITCTFTELPKNVIAVQVADSVKIADQMKVEDQT